MRDRGFDQLKRILVFHIPISEGSNPSRSASHLPIIECEPRASTPNGVVRHSPEDLNTGRSVRLAFDLSFRHSFGQRTQGVALRYIERV